MVVYPLEQFCCNGQLIGQRDKPVSTSRPDFELVRYLGELGWKVAVFGPVGPCFHPLDNLEIDVNGVVTSGTRVDARHFFGLADLELADEDLASIGEGNRQCG